jgi:hypothetical protein
VARDRLDPHSKSTTFCFALPTNVLTRVRAIARDADTSTGQQLRLLIAEALAAKEQHHGATR